MARNRGHSARHRLVDMGEPVEPGGQAEGWTPDPEVELVEDVFVTFMDPPGNRIRVVSSRGESVLGLQKFAMMVDYEVAGTWESVYRVDTSHGTVHEHRYFEGPDVRRELHVLRGQHELEDRYQQCMVETYARAVDYVERWRRGAP